MSSRYAISIRNHYDDNWMNTGEIQKWDKGPVHQLPSGFTILRYSPNTRRNLWTYATVGMSTELHSNPLEIFIVSKVESAEIVELLTVVSHYHNTGRMLSLGHIVNFGRAWISSSKCSHGLISLPYLDGPCLENCVLDSRIVVRCLWLVPICSSEREYALRYGQDELEVRFEEKHLDYANPSRQCVV